MEINSKPEELDEVERKIMQLEIEREAIKREKDETKLASLNEEIANLSDRRSDIRAKWEAEKELVEGIQKSKDEIETLKYEAEQAERDGNLGLVAEIRYGKIKDAEQRLEGFKTRLISEQKDSKLIKEEVDVDEIAEVVGKWTGIPVTKMLESDKEKLLEAGRCFKETCNWSG
jgi:ATP-dependent Clp protease ATP-binding subunit ClpB